MPGARHTVGLATARIRDTGIERAGGGKGGHVQEIIGEAAITNRPNHIRSIETFPCAGVVAFEEVVEVEPLSVLQIHDAIESPTVFKFCQAAAHLGDLVRKVPGEATTDVKTRIAAISLRIKAVRRLRLIGN